MIGLSTTLLVSFTVLAAVLQVIYDAQPPVPVPAPVEPAAAK
jgi:hypothetical protein